MPDSPSDSDVQAVRSGVDKVVAAAGAVIIGFLLYILIANRGAIFDKPTRYTVPAETFYLPQGDPTAGRQVLVQMRCTACHRVAGETFDPPVADPPVPVALDAALGRQPPWRVAESIVAPSHRVPQDIAHVGEAGLSRMGNYGHVMTVQQLTDLVAYLRSLQPSAAK